MVVEGRTDLLEYIDRPGNIDKIFENYILHKDD